MTIILPTLILIYNIIYISFRQLNIFAQFIRIDPDQAGQVGVHFVICICQH